MIFDGELHISRGYPVFLPSTYHILSTMARRIDVTLAALILAVLVPDYLTQRTFRRACDCEYTVDGRCAYTLLLPNPALSNTPVCPAGRDESNSLETELQYVQNNVTQLRAWMGDQSRMLSQLQSSMLLLQMKTDTFVRASNVNVSHPSGTDAGDDVSDAAPTLHAASVAEQLALHESELEVSTSYWQGNHNCILQNNTSCFKHIHNIAFQLNLL